MAKEIFASTENLLQNDYEPIINESRVSRWRTLLKRLCLLFVFILLIYNAIVVTMSLPVLNADPGLPYSPANSVLSYERHRLWTGESSFYQQSPSAEVDDAWNNLLVGLNLRVSKEEMILANEDIDISVQLKNGDYQAELEVFHQLHCLDALRRFVHKDYYFENATEAELRDLNGDGHLDHCIDILRRSAMCHAELAFYSMKWIADSHQSNAKTMVSNSERKCANWDAIANWARGRAIEEKKFIVRPGPFEHTSRHE